MINHGPGIHKINLSPTDSIDAKYQLLIKKREDASLKHFNDPKLLKLLLDTQKIWMISIKILKNTI